MARVAALLLLVLGVCTAQPTLLSISAAGESTTVRTAGHMWAPSTWQALDGSLNIWLGMPAELQFFGYNFSSNSSISLTYDVAVGAARMVAPRATDAHDMIARHGCRVAARR